MITPNNPWTDEDRQEIDNRIALANSAGCELPDEMIEGIAMFATALRGYGVLLWQDYQAIGDERLTSLLKNVERMLLP